ncbi:MAG: DUF4065 domain-containing protein [Fibrobacter sp.]|nr:DUF4065 domain-containing protein [Fibrobacter sp.]
MPVVNGKKNILDVAYYMIYKSILLQYSITPLKLQKLLYYFQSWHMVYFDGDSVFPDVPQAWVNGPVYKKVYEAFSSKAYAYTELSNVDEFVSDCDKKAIEYESKLAFSEREKDFFDQFINTFGPKDAGYLVLLTHSEQPWLSARGDLNPNMRSDKEISLDSMLNFYSNLHG